jgi:hypothetical protein
MAAAAAPVVSEGSLGLGAVWASVMRAAGGFRVLHFFLEMRALVARCHARAHTHTHHSLTHIVVAGEEPTPLPWAGVAATSGPGSEQLLSGLGLEEEEEAGAGSEQLPLAEGLEGGEDEAAGGAAEGGIEGVDGGGDEEEVAETGSRDGEVAAAYASGDEEASMHTADAEEEEMEMGVVELAEQQQQRLDAEEEEEQGGRAEVEEEEVEVEVEAEEVADEDAPDLDDILLAGAVEEGDKEGAAAGRGQPRSTPGFLAVEEC